MEPQKNHTLEMSSLQILKFGYLLSNTTIAI